MTLNSVWPLYVPDGTPCVFKSRHIVIVIELLEALSVGLLIEDIPFERHPWLFGLCIEAYTPVMPCTCPCKPTQQRLCVRLHSWRIL